MKLQLVEVTCKTNMTGKEIPFNVGAGAEGTLIEFLRNKVYSYPIRTMVQEYISNALDACVDAGKDASAITITLPTKTNLTFSVRDHGKGLSDSQIRSIYTQYGISTKQTTDTQIGGFGIGSKSAWAYTDSFLFISYYDGQKTTYLAHVGTDSKGTLKLISSEPSTETGVDIQIAVKPGDIDEIYSAVFRITAFAQTQPNIINAPENFTAQKLYQHGGMSVYEKSKWFHVERSEGFISAQGIPYSIDMNDYFTGASSLRRNFIYIFDVPEISKLNITLGREGFQNTDYAYEIVNNAIEQLQAYMKTLGRPTLDETRKAAANVVKFAPNFIRHINQFTKDARMYLADDEAEKVGIVAGFEGIFGYYLRSGRADIFGLDARGKPKFTAKCHFESNVTGSYTRTSWQGLSADSAQETRRRISALVGNSNFSDMLVIARKECSTPASTVEAFVSFLGADLIDLDSDDLKGIKAQRTVNRDASYKVISTGTVRGVHKVCLSDKEELSEIDESCLILWCTKKECAELTTKFVEDLDKFRKAFRWKEEFSSPKHWDAEIIEVNKEAEIIVKNMPKEKAMNIRDWVASVCNKDALGAELLKLAGSSCQSKYAEDFCRWPETFINDLAAVVSEIPDLKAEIELLKHNSNIPHYVFQMLDLLEINRPTAASKIDEFFTKYPLLQLRAMVRSWGDTKTQYDAEFVNYVKWAKENGR